MFGIKKSIIFIVLNLLVCTAISAQEDAKQLLMQKLSTVKSFSAAFQQTVTDAQDNIVNEAQGNIALAQPNKLRWHTQLPDEILLVATGEDVYQVDYFVEQVTVLSQSETVENNPMMLLTSNSPKDWEKFDVIADDDQFSITAKQESAIQQLIIVFSGDTLASLTSIDSQEQRSVLAFSEQKLNQPMALNVFEPDMPPGFFVDDQRR